VIGNNDLCDFGQKRLGNTALSGRSETVYEHAYLRLNHENATESHLVDDGKNIDDVFVLQLLKQNVESYERARATDASAADTNRQETVPDCRSLFGSGAQICL